MAPQLSQALEDLKAAIYAVNSFQTTSRFLDSFSDLNAQSPEVQKAVERVTRYAQELDDKAAWNIQEAQATFNALSDEDQNEMLRFYGEDLLVYLEIKTPRDLLHNPTKPFNDLQISIFDVENLHRALGRVRGVEANITGVFSGLPSIQKLMQINREEELRLLKLRTAAEDLLYEQFLALSREKQDLLWIWYPERLKSSGIQRNKAEKNPYSGLSIS